MKCRYCGTNTKERYCENCGAFMDVTDETEAAQNGSSIRFETYETRKMERPKDKSGLTKIFWLIVVVAAIVVLGAATGYDKLTKILENSGNSSSNTSSVAPAPAPEKKSTFGIGETAEFNTLKITANKMEESAGDGFFAAPEGKIYVGVQFTVENISNEEKHVGSLFDAYLDDIKIEDTSEARITFNVGSLSGQLAAGKKLQGWYAVEVPSDWSEMEIHVTDLWDDDDVQKAIFVIKK